jgi:hypothetical protein
MRGRAVRELVAWALLALAMTVQLHSRGQLEQCTKQLAWARAQEHSKVDVRFHEKRTEQIERRWAETRPQQSSSSDLPTDTHAKRTATSREEKRAHARARTNTCMRA